jgi:hypothetical protein
MAGHDQPATSVCGAGLCRACAQWRGLDRKGWHSGGSRKGNRRVPVPLSLPSSGGQLDAVATVSTLPTKSKPAYSSDETRCRGFRPAEAGEGACGPLRSPKGGA